MPALTEHAPWDDYAARVTALFPPLRPGDGVAEGELSAAESALGFRLPRVLREFYLLAGNRGDLTHHWTQPIAPKFLAVVDQALVFAAGNEDFPPCAILQTDLGHDDPPVVLADGVVRPFDWASDQERLSSWFVSMLYWVAIQGGLPYSGSAPVDETEIPAVHAHWPRVDLLGSLWDRRIVFHRAGQVVVVDGHSPDLVLRAAGRTCHDFEAISRRLGLEWQTPEDDSSEEAPKFWFRYG
jgi:hypothetical protein